MGQEPLPERKNIDKGRMVITFMMGTRKLYDFVNDNPAICMKPVSYVNDPLVISQNDNVVSINSACRSILWARSVLKQLDSSSILLGRPDGLCRGRLPLKGGRSIIAFGATTRGTISKIASS